MKNNKMREEIKHKLFFILSDYGDFFLTDYPKQAETKSVHPTISRILEVFDQFVSQKEKELKKDKFMSGFRKGYFKGVLDSEYGQVTSEELLKKKWEK
jgi:hypothetical protein